MSSLSHLRQNNLRSKQQWVKAHPLKVRKTTHTTYVAEDAEGDPITCDIRHAQPVDLGAHRSCASIIGHIRRYTGYVCVASLHTN
jgi:hypothetical protein